jgi:hypothetical protein
MVFHVYCISSCCVIWNLPTAFVRKATAGKTMGDFPATEVAVEIFKQPDAYTSQRGPPPLARLGGGWGPR